MTRDEAVALIKARVQRSGDSTLADADIVTEMQYIQKYVLEGGDFLPWFLITDYTDASFVTVADTEAVAVPTGFLREVEDGALWIDNASSDAANPWTELDKDSYDALRASPLYDGTGKPRKYALVSTSFYLKATPNDAYLLRLMAYFRDTVLTTNVENNWLAYAADWIINETGILVATNYIRDDVMAATFAAQAARAKKRVTTENEARMHANRNYRRGDD